jgi:hypothetical protein
MKSRCKQRPAFEAMLAPQLPRKPPDLARCFRLRKD